MSLPTRPHHIYDPHSKFVKTAAYQAFYRAVVLPMLGRYGGVTRMKAYPILYKRMLRQLSNLNLRWNRLAGDGRERRLQLMFNCPMPGSLTGPATAWECRERYVCPFCYGRSIIDDFDYLKAALPAEPLDSDRELYLCSQTFDWPEDLNTPYLADYLTRFTHAAVLYAHRYVPAAGPVGLLRDLSVDNLDLPAVSRVLVWPSVDPLDDLPRTTVKFAIIGLRPRMPKGMRRLKKWTMPSKIKDEICAGPPEVFQVGEPEVKTLLAAVGQGFRYPHQLFSGDPEHTASILNAISGKRLRMVRRVGTHR